MQLSESRARTALSARQKRAAVELIARDGPELRRTARRYSFCEEDAEDAYQRALEILLVKAPSDRPRDLIRWTKTVVKHEALAIRRNRERLLGMGAPPAVDDEWENNPADLVSSGGDSPEERAEGHELVARSREALRSLKPAELRSLTLLAAGYSYAEIGEITGFSQTKVNRCLAEGRERFRRLLSRSEDGSRCAEMGPLLSAFCDGETSAEEAAAVRAHLQACAGCRATMRAYRSAPAAVAALAPALPVPRSLLERAQELLLGLQSRLPGTGGATGDAGMAQVAAAGGARGAGMAATAKLLAICVGTVGGAAACVATGVAPAPLDLTPQAKEPRIERASERAVPPPVEYEPAPLPEPKPAAPSNGNEAVEEGSTASEPPAGAAAAGAVEYAPPPPVQPPSGEPPAASSGSAAGEFGP
jgi:RNA polymerase sigma factor (sigma-70 family)